MSDYRWKPFAAFKASRIDQAHRLKLPRKDIPYDILVRDGKAYILTNRCEEKEGTCTAVIYYSEDLEYWEEYIRFDIPSPARSFEYYGGEFYIGLGTDMVHPHPAGGTIYRITP